MRPPEAIAQIARSFELRGRTRRCVELTDWAGKDVLNVGCSFGWFEEHVTGSARRVVGIDLSEENLAVARRLAPRAEFYFGSALELPFGNGEFDVVTIFDVIEHLPKGTEGIALVDARRVLRDGGVLALSTPNWQTVSTLTDPAFYFGHRHYARRDLELMLGAAGFIIRSSEIGGGPFDQLELLFSYASRHLLRRESRAPSFIRSLADAEWRGGRAWNTHFVLAEPAPAR